MGDSAICASRAIAPFTHEQVNSHNVPLIRIVVPTFRRPAMLRRALVSLLGQEEKRWAAVVLDDSPNAESESIIRSLADSRIAYQFNARQVGAAANIDRAFDRHFIGHATYACLLEDDNYFLPSYLRHVVDVMEETGAALAMFNQLIARGDGNALSERETTRGSWFSEGWIGAEDLHASLLLMEGLSNGGVVWRTESDVHLAVGSKVKLTGLHEACRSLLVRTPLWFSQKALAVWSENPQSETARSAESSRSIGRGYQAIIQFVLDKYGWSAVSRALMFADSGERMDHLISRLVHAGAIATAVQVDASASLKKLPLFAKGLALKAITTNPCHKFLKSIG